MSKSSNVIKDKRLSAVAKIKSLEITVTAKPGGNSGNPDISYSPEILCVGKGSRKVTLILDDPLGIGYQFSGFHWLPQAMAVGYVKHMDIDASRIELMLENEFKHQIDYPYEVFVSLKAASAAAMRKAALKQSLGSRPGALKKSEVAPQLKLLAMASDAFARGVTDLEAVYQLRSGPVIRNDPGG